MKAPKTNASSTPTDGPTLFDTLSEELSTANAKAVPLPAGSDDIGGELIAILSKGLYTNPLDCLREYAQNGGSPTNYKCTAFRCVGSIVNWST